MKRKKYTGQIMEGNGFDRPAKKRKLQTDPTSTNQRRPLTTLNAPVSPPPRRGPRPQPQGDVRTGTSTIPVPESKVIPSPFQLTSIKDLPPALNVDTITLKGLLGDPLIKECWNFNYCHDIEFILDAFDSDVRDQVQVKVIHGFWKREDRSRLILQEQASTHPNVQLLSAFLPDAYGTHHSKMLILIRHDDSAQVIIHTANMIAMDWENMTQAVWKSPLLPELADGSNNAGSSIEPVGSGPRFKFDLLNYLRAYDTQRVICRPLVQQLEKYNFSEIHAALVASVPCHQDVDSNVRTAWGWPGLKTILNSIPVHPSSTGPAEVIAQVSSISTLSEREIAAIKKALLTSQNPPSSLSVQSAFKVIFPTADEIRRSLNGWLSGNSIHTKMGAGKTKAQEKQLQNFRPMLNYWAGDGAAHAETARKEAGRRRAAPHIKTYVRFTDPTLESIDWALVTSANLSNQAWGGTCSAAGDVWIKSYEIGVLVWPELFGKDVVMVPTFKSDMPKAEDNKTMIGFRMPYDTPLVSYGEDETPFCATKAYEEVDWNNQKWTPWG